MRDDYALPVFRPENGREDLAGIGRYRLRWPQGKASFALKRNSHGCLANTGRFANIARMSAMMRALLSNPSRREASYAYHRARRAARWWDTPRSAGLGRTPQGSTIVAPGGTQQGEIAADDWIASRLADAVDVREGGGMENPSFNECLDPATRTGCKIDAKVPETLFRP